MYNEYVDKYTKVSQSEYDGKKMSVRMVEELDLTICPYCNREYINSRDEDCAGAQLDHFYNKSTYPIFSLCLYNLVPVCGNCNRIKSSKKCDFASPFDLDIDFDNGLKFSLLTDGDDITRIQIVVNEDCKKLKNNISEMKIENSYQIHRKDVLELQKKLKQYSDTQLQEMFKITNIPAIQIKEMIFGPKIDSNIMNCYTINIVDGKATLDDKKKNEECNAEIAGNYELKIIRENDKTSDKWYKESEELSAVKSDNSVDDSLIYTWTTDLNPNTIWDKRKFDLKNLLSEKGGVINDVFYVQANSQDTDKVYRSAGKRIKIDKVKPIIDSADAGEQNDWVKQRDVTIKAHDLGSGIVGYLFSDKADCSGNFEKLTKPQNEFTLKRTFKSNGEYYFCLIDDAGNISDSEKIVIQKVDGKPPKCYYNNENYEWHSGSRTISYGCQDDESGCDKLIVNGRKTYTCSGNNCNIFTQNKTYNGTYKNIKINDINQSIGTFKIIDKNGNETTCPDSNKQYLNLFLDNTTQCLIQMDI